MRHKWRRRAAKKRRIFLAALENVTQAFEFAARYSMGVKPLQEALKESAQPAANYYIQQQRAERQLANADFEKIERQLLALGYTVEIDY